MLRKLLSSVVSNKTSDIACIYNKVSCLVGLTFEGGGGVQALSPPHSSSISGYTHDLQIKTFSPVNKWHLSLQTTFLSFSFNLLF